MTPHDPRPPTDDQLRAWREAAFTDQQIPQPTWMCLCANLCDALLAERAAHTATKAENERLRSDWSSCELCSATWRFRHHAGCYYDRPEVKARALLAALADPPEEPR